MQFAGRPVESDPSAGDWIAAALRPMSEHVVGSLVPPLFEAYARVFHPAASYVGDDDVDVTWAEVAAANRTVAHPAMEWGSITGLMEYFDQADQSPLWEGAPARGHLPEHVARRIVEVLARHTTTSEDCWFGIWHGFGSMTTGAMATDAMATDAMTTGAMTTDTMATGAPTLVLPGREMWLVRGPVGLAAQNLAPEPAEQSANLWWAADRSWAVATDIDLVTTYVGGTRACIAELLAHPGLEAAAVPASQRITWDADTVNPLPLDGPD